MITILNNILFALLTCLNILIVAAAILLLLFIILAIIVAIYKLIVGDKASDRE